MAEWYPCFTTELLGVAEGCDTDPVEVALVNFRHTIIYSALAETEPDGCTSFGIEPSVSATEDTYIGQNWDWKAGIQKLLTTVRSDKTDYLSLTEAGLVGGKLGFNEEHGIGFTVNGLTTPDDGANPFRTPAHVRAHQILSSNRLDQAIVAIIGTTRPTSRNYLIGEQVAKLSILRRPLTIISSSTLKTACWFTQSFPHASGCSEHA